MQHPTAFVNHILNINQVSYSVNVGHSVKNLKLFLVEPDVKVSAQHYLDTLNKY